MARRCCLLLWLLLGACSVSGNWSAAQETEPHIRVIVNLVQLNVAVTDNKGNYVTGLKPTDFVISEDGIAEKLATFEEGNGPTIRLLGVAPPPKAAGDAVSPSDDPNQTLAEAIAGSN